MLAKGFESYHCDELECMSYNVSLDLILKLFEKYPRLKRISVWSNTEKIKVSAKCKNAILEMVDKKQINFYHLPENVNIVHGKIYAFKKEGTVCFLGIGSPNLSEHANQNFEALCYFYDKDKCAEILSEIPKCYLELNLNPRTNIPIEICPPEDLGTKIDPKFIEGLWKHQAEVVMWIGSRKNSIINIPPGTGKTQIALTYLQYLMENVANLTCVVLVPTRTLISQWRNRLDKNNIPNFEWGTSLSNLGGYFADPAQKALVTIYSRFFKQYVEYYKRAKILKPNVLIVIDECHNAYGHIPDLANFRKMMQSYGCQVYSIGLSATIDSFRTWEVEDLLNFAGGQENRFEISLQSFYSYWNDLNQTPVLKKIRYTPVKYCLTEKELKKFKDFSKRVAIEMNKRPLDGSEDATAAIQRARWLRGLSGGIQSLQDYFMKNMADFANKATIVFVQTNEIAEHLQEFITRQPGWNPESSIYIYDHTREDDYRSYALEQFKRHLGFCLISEKMLSEGFDLPKVDKVVLHGSDRSPRDWIQKIGRAIRFDRENPEAIAEIVDVVFCEKNGEPLLLEKERYSCLLSISE
jgi:superfamily II DNA or RNA helicase